YQIDTLDKIYSDQSIKIALQEALLENNSKNLINILAEIAKYLKSNIESSLKKELLQQI
ncbi:7067_t:CDS:1, partial [Scutellospora calospora]